MVKEYFEHNYLTNTSDEKVLYIHIPYCVRKCKYCVCQSNVMAEKTEIRKYIEEVVLHQLAEYTDLLGKVKIDQLYIGGGTPTILSIDELNNIFEAIPGFEAIPLKCIEASPETLTNEHIELFVKKNFSFVSIGVQSLDKAICKKQNRYHVSKEELIKLSQRLLQTGIYFNFDLICFMDKGDVRDLPQFSDDLTFVMKECRPSSITIHQLQQTMFTCEKTAMLQEVIKKAMLQSEEYQCVNSLLQEEDVYNDTVFQAEYRLACRDYSFSHYMWNKYAALPVKGYDILSVGYTEFIHTISNAGSIFYSPGENKIKRVKFNSYIYDDFERIRKEKGFIV
ncbi:radical SAM protein [Methanobrevibacter ruminantium]|uniref:radical SAM protein n=1 Tax=Methanobrevibacter ruminantium TaxID=83816 RepID=UPI0026F28E43|nr:radical SAM protein [Methanobrevibacter ruminantium]